MLVHVIRVEVSCGGLDSCESHGGYQRRRWLATGYLDRRYPGFEHVCSTSGVEDFTGLDAYLHRHITGNTKPWIL